MEEAVLSGLSGRRPLVYRYTAADRAQARSVMARMGLEGLGNRAIGSLSGGQLQRALLGRAVISDPEVIVLDEPDTYMDRDSTTRLYDLLAEINRTCAVVLVSHDAEAVSRLARSVAWVDGTLDYRTRAGG